MITIWEMKIQSEQERMVGILPIHAWKQFCKNEDLFYIFVLQWRLQLVFLTLDGTPALVKENTSWAQICVSVP